jgi:EmrB/QacA subfamily drug resistance transporter
VKRKWLILFGTGMSGITIGLDLTIVNSSLPNIQRELGANISQLQWIMAGFGLFFCAFLVIMGRFGDIYGRKKFLISSLILFSLVSFGAGSSTSANVLIIMRMLQGLFGAAILPCGTALTAHAFSKDEQGQALGIYSSLVGIGIGTGPLLGGIIDNALDWRWIFYINIPIIFISLIICASIISESKLAKRIEIDWKGGVFLALVLGLVAFVISEGEFYGWMSWQIVSASMIGLISFLLFYLREKKANIPIIPLYLFRNSGFILATIIYAGAVAFHWPVLFLMPIYLRNVIGYTSGSVSLILSSMTLMTIISPLLAGYFYDKKSKSLIVHIIFALNIISLLMFFTFNENGPLWIIFPSFILFGLAWGIGNGIATPIALSQLSNSENTGVVSGAITTVLNIFAVFSLTFTSTIFQISKRYFFIKKSSGLISISDAKLLDTYTKAELSKQVSIMYPEHIGNSIITIYKTSFLHGMNSAYFLIFSATLVCWLFANKLIKSVFKFTKLASFTDCGKNNSL